MVYGIVWCGVVWYCMARCDVVGFGLVCLCLIWCGIYCMAQRAKVRSDMVRYGRVSYFMVARYGMVWCSMCGTYCMARSGMVRCGMVWHDIRWSDARP